MSSTIFSRRNQKFLIFAALAIVAIVSSTEAASIPAEIQQRPNIIVIQPDDHLFLEEWNPPARFEYEASTVPPTSMTSEMQPDYISPVPNINRLRNDGLEMTNAYAASTMCGTSRYSTLTGRYPSRSAYGRQNDSGSWYYGNVYLRDVMIPNTKLEDVWGVEDGNDCSSNNLAAVLKQHGYSTGVVGKWHLENTDNVSAGGLYRNNGQVRDKIRNCGFDFAEAIYRENLDDDYNVDGGYVTHNMEHITSEAIRFIQESVAPSDKDKKEKKLETEEDEDAPEESDSNPFFLYFNPTVPHDSGDVTEALSSASCRETVDGRLSEEPHIPYGMTAGGKMTCREYRQTVLDRAAASSATMERRMDTDKMAGAVWVDDAIGALLETLEALEVLDNTLILFQLDHGLVAKGSVFEGGSRIVQFIHYPDQIQVDRSQEQSSEEQQGWKFDGLVSTIDIAPTLMDLAGVPLASTSDEAPKHGHPRYQMDGKSWFSEVLAANSAEEQTSTALRQQRQKKSIDSNYFQDRCLFVEEGLDRAVRCGCYKYIYVNDPNSGFTVREANERGVSLRTNNYYNLCDESTESYISWPRSSPELQSRGGDDQISEEIKTKLQNKVDCLMIQTNPYDTFPDYETDCGLPLFPDEDDSSENIEHSENIVIEADKEDPPKEFPEDSSPSSPSLNKPPSQDFIDGFLSGEPGAGNVPLFATPSSSSKSSAVEGSVSKSTIIVVTLVLLLAPCFIYWIYRELCRRLLADRYRLEAKQQEIEKNILQSAITTRRGRRLEVGSTRIENIGQQMDQDIETDSTKNSFWAKLADEMRRQAALREKWNVVAVSGVVIGASNASVATETSTEVSLRSEGSVEITTEDRNVVEGEAEIEDLSSRSDDSGSLDSRQEEASVEFAEV